MPNYINSANMNLPIPVVGVDPGPQYANDINSSLTLIDSHDHSSGSGVQITPSGINITSSLTMNNNSLIDIQALTLQAQSADQANISLYAKGVDLYFRDGSANVIRITQSGNVAGAAGTITGLPSGTASAAFAASTFTFQASTLTAANIDGASHIFRLNTASSNALTLSPPAALSGGSYQLFLPTIPVSTSLMTLDASGNMGTTTVAAIGPQITNTAANLVSGTKYVVVGEVAEGSQLRILRGTTNGVGLIVGSGFGITELTPGTYAIAFNVAFASPPSVVASPDYPFVAAVNSITASGCNVILYNLSGAPQTQAFNFIAIGPR